MEELIADTSEVLAPYADKDSTFYIEPAPKYQFPAQVQVQYTGQFRPIPEKRATLISYWIKATDPEQAEEVVAMFDTEALFIADTIEYWFPVQRQLIPYLEAELQEGDNVTVFLLWIGALVDQGEFDRVFLMNEFRHPGGHEKELIPGQHTQS
jgi:hypothetical protein